MGVLPCAREGCENIMCDRYSDEHGYICDECFSGLCAIYPVNIEEFMNTKKKRAIDHTSVLEQIFVSRWSDE